jgi:hypothetical protein
MKKMDTIQAYGNPGDITLLPKMPVEMSYYETYATLLTYNYIAMKILPEAPITGRHAT